MRDAAIFEMVELVQRNGDRLPSWGNAEHFAGVGAGNLGPHPGASLRPDNLMDGDVDVRKRREKLLHHRLEAVGAGALAGCERDVLPVGGNGFMEQIRVLFGKRPIQGPNGTILGFRKRTDRRGSNLAAWE